MCLNKVILLSFHCHCHCHYHSLSLSLAYPRFSDFVSLMERHADVLNDPVYGGDALISSTRKPSGTSSAPSNRNISSFTQYSDLYSHQFFLMVIKIFLEFRHNSRKPVYAPHQKKKYLIIE